MSKTVELHGVNASRRVAARYAQRPTFLTGRGTMAVGKGDAARLRSRRPVGDRLRTAKGVYGLFDCEQRRRLQFRQRATAGDRDPDCGHRDIIRSFPEAVAVVRAERVPEAVQLPAD